MSSELINFLSARNDRFFQSIMCWWSSELWWVESDGYLFCDKGWMSFNMRGMYNNDHYNHNNYNDDYYNNYYHDNHKSVIFRILATRNHLSFNQKELKIEHTANRPRKHFKKCQNLLVKSFLAQTYTKYWSKLWTLHQNFTIYPLSLNFLVRNLVIFLFRKWNKKRLLAS